MRESIRAALVAGFLLSSGAAVAAPPKKKNPLSACSKPPELVSRRLPKDEEDRAKKIRAVGSVSVAISEDGEVVEANTAVANSDEAEKILVDLAKSYKFKPRPGCGPFKTNFNFHFDQAN